MIQRLGRGLSKPRELVGHAILGLWPKIGTEICFNHNVTNMKQLSVRGMQIQRKLIVQLKQQEEIEHLKQQMSNMAINQRSNQKRNKDKNDRENKRSGPPQQNKDRGNGNGRGEWKPRKNNKWRNQSAQQQ